MEILFVCATGALLVVVIFLKYALRRQRYYHLMPSKRHGFFNVLGDLREFNFLKEFRTQLLDVLNSVVKIYPKEQMVCVWVSYTPLLFVVKSNAMREVLKENRMIEKGFQYEWLKPGIGTGLISSPSGIWKSRRRLFNPCFHPDILRDYLKTFNYTSQKLVNVLKDEAEKDSVDILDPLTLCAFDAMFETIFNHRIHGLQNNTEQVLNSLKWLMSTVMFRMYAIWLWPDFIFRNTKTGKEFEQHLNVVKEFTRKIIEEKRQRYLSGERAHFDGKHKALIDVMLEKLLETKEFTEDDVLDEMITFLAAAHETIAITVMWALYMIGHYPEVQAKLLEEIDLVFGKDGKRPVTEKDLKDLQYMDCVLKECQRIYPTVPLTTRNATEDIQICGTTVPKDTTCVIGTYFLHRDEKVFPNPEKFDPDRFAPENRVKIPDFAYIPFSGGPRNCIGYKFAEMEVGTIVCYILRNFTVESLNKVLPVPGISLDTSKPIRIKIRNRAVRES